MGSGLTIGDTEPLTHICAYKAVSGATDVSSKVVSAGSRLAPGWKPNHYDSNTAGVKEPPGHGAIQLRRGQIARVLRDVMDGINESRALPAVARRVGRNFCGAGIVSASGIDQGPRQALDGGA